MMLIMQVVTSDFVNGKKVLLRYDIDVALGKGTGDSLQVTEDFKLRAGLKTLKLCIDNAEKIIIMGHVGRPFKTAEDEKNGNPPKLSAKPIQVWLEKELGQSVEFALSLDQAKNSSAKIILLENIRFFHGEILGSEYHASCVSKTCDVDFAKSLASLGDSPSGEAGVFVNEAFSSHNKSVSTTVLPTLLPHRAGEHFIKEVETLLKVRNNPKKPFIAIMGGAKVVDKLPVITVLAKSADAVLVGGKLIHEIRDQKVDLAKNVMVGKLNDDGFDISPDTTDAWSGLIKGAKMIVWNGPVGKFEEEKYNQTESLIKLVLQSGAEVVIGGGDSVAALNQYGMLQEAEKVAFVSVGGGAMLKLIADGTLPTIQALN